MTYEVTTIKEATEQFLKGLTYYGDLDSATLALFRLAAKQIDAQVESNGEAAVTLLTEYRRQKEAIQALGINTEGEEQADPLLGPLEALQTR